MIFGSTRGAINHLLRVARLAAFFTSLVMQLIYVIYLSYITVSGRGILGVNVAMWVLSVGYLVYFLITEYRVSGMRKAERQAERKAGRGIRQVYRWLKIGFKAFNLIIILYSVWANETDQSAFSTIFTTLMIIVWIVELIIALGTVVISYVSGVIMDAIEDDRRAISDKINAPGRAIRKVSRGIKRFFGFGKDEDEPLDSTYVRDERFVRWEAELEEEKSRDEANR